jgi:ribosomal protein S18 acetylase RimI-like enzyme
VLPAVILFSLEKEAPSMVNIRPAHASDLERIAQLLPRVVSSMQADGNDQWQADYPKPEDYARDVEQGRLWVIIQSGRMAGTVCINDVTFPEYDAIPWTLTGPYLTIHRLAVDPDFRRRGFARALLTFAEEQARALGMTHMRLDTYSLNLPMQKLLLSAGYEKRGEFFFPSRSNPFYAYEKAL